jgi:hypothetical protein
MLSSRWLHTSVSWFLSRTSAGRYRQKSNNTVLSPITFDEVRNVLSPFHNKACLKFLCATEKNQERAALSTYASQVSSELIACEEHLSCHIEGVGLDKLLFRISNIDPEDDAREGSFVLDVAGSYKGA